MPRPRRSFLEVLFSELRWLVVGTLIAIVGAVAFYFIFTSQIPRITDAMLGPLKHGQEPAKAK